MNAKKPTPAVVENLKAAATLCGVTIAEVKRAKRAGCAAFQLGGRIHIAKFRAWLRDHPKPKARIVESSLATGAPAALSRLEQSEAASFNAMQAETDPDERERRRREWLATSEALRKADVSLDQVRRESGQIMLRSEAEQQAADACYLIFLALQQTFANELPPRLVGLSDVEIGVMLQSQINRMREVLRTEFGRLSGKKVVSEDFKKIALCEDARLALFVCSQKAFTERVSNLWSEFLEWRKQIERDRCQHRREWCMKRVSEGLPVPDATDAELREIPGLKRA